MKRRRPACGAPVGGGRYRDETTLKIVTEDQWRYRRLVTLPDGTKERITGTSELNTKAAALIAEASHIKRVLNQDKGQDAGTFSAFWTKRWWPTVTGTPSTRQEKEITTASTSSRTSAR